MTISAQGILNLLTRQRDELLQERDAAREMHCRAVRERHAAEEALTRVETERLQTVGERDHLREVIEFVLSEHHLGYCTLTSDTLTILWAVVCKKEEEEEGPSLMNETVGEQGNDATDL